MFKKLFIIFTIVLMVITGCGNNEIEQDNNKKEEVIINKIEIESESQAAEEIQDNKVKNIFGNTNGNIINGGIATQQGELVFYSTGAKIYKEDINFNKREEIDINMEIDIDEGYLCYLNIAGEWLYFIHATLIGEGQDTLYRVKIDGTGLEQLTKDNVYRILVKDDFIYMINRTDNYRIYKMGLDGKNPTPIIDDKVYAFNIIDDDIYCFIFNETDEFILNRFGLENTQNEQMNFISEEKIPFDMILNDKQLFSLPYVEEFKRILSSKTIEDGIENILADDVSSFNIAEDRIYYSQYNEGLFSMDLNGGDITKLSMDSGIFLSIIEDWIYYHENYMTIRMKKDGTERERLDI